MKDDTVGDFARQGDAEKDLRIRSVEVIPLSMRFSPENATKRSFGVPVKRDTIIVKITTECGVVGYGEAHHARAPKAVVELIKAMVPSIENASAVSVNRIWSTLYDKHVKTHGMGAGSYVALSGIDMALWDARAKYLNLPIYQLLGGQKKKKLAYAGGFALSLKPIPAYLDEVSSLAEKGFRAMKLRFGDTARNDVERLAAVRKAHDDLIIMVDANTQYSLDDVRYVSAALHECGVAWLEEPFAPHDVRLYREAKPLLKTALAAGENHYGRSEFIRLIEDQSVTVLQPDPSKTGGITECLRIAQLASAWKLQIHPHVSATSLNHAATLHILCAIENDGFYEADAAVQNDYRDVVTAPGVLMDKEGYVTPSDAPGLGIEVDEKSFKTYTYIDGPAYR